VVEGQSYTIPCGTTVDADVKWFFDSAINIHRYSYTVYYQGSVRKEFLPRFSLNTSVPSLYGLDISDVQLNDTGNYTCIDDYAQGDEHIHRLIVQGKCRP